MQLSAVTASAQGYSFIYQLVDIRNFGALPPV